MSPGGNEKTCDLKVGIGGTVNVEAGFSGTCVLVAGCQAEPGCGAEHCVFKMDEVDDKNAKAGKTDLFVYEMDTGRVESGSAMAERVEPGGKMAG